MKKFLLVFICFLISQLLIGQSNSLVINNKKSGKESTINEGRVIKVYTDRKTFYRGKFKILYDSSINSTMIKIDNTTIPIEAVKQITCYDSSDEFKLAFGGILSTLGPIGGLVSMNTYNNNRGFLDVIYLIPAAISGVILVSGMVLLGTTTSKYQNILEVKKAKGG
jgi:hypothetical protein